MSRCTKVIQYDHMRIKAMFDDGSTFVLSIGWSGANHIAEPSDAVADELSCVMDDLLARFRELFESRTGLLDTIEENVSRSPNRRTLVDALVARYGCPRSKPIVATPDRPRQTRSTPRTERIEAVFPSGEALSVHVGKTSVSAKVWPPVLTRMDRVMRAATAVFSVSTNKTQASHEILGISKASTSLDDWERRAVELVAELAERNAPAALDVVETRSTATIKPSRGGFLVDAVLEDGTSLTCKMSAKSLAVNAAPFDGKALDALSRLLFGQMRGGVLVGEPLAETVSGAIRASRSLEELLEALPGHLSAANAALASGQPFRTTAPVAASSPRP